MDLNEHAQRIEAAAKQLADLVDDAVAATGLKVAENYANDIRRLYVEWMPKRLRKESNNG